MASYRFLLLGLVAWPSAWLSACNDAPLDDTDLAETDAVSIANETVADAPSWQAADTLHANTRQFDYASAHTRRVHSLWVAGSASSPVPLTIAAHASEGYDVRIAVLGPLVNGTRAVLGADGYASAKHTASVTLEVATRGEHLVVVGSYGLEHETFYELSASCTGCESNVDVLATPKDFGLVGDEHGLVRMELGDVLAGYTSDIEVELWASPPMQWWNAQHVATSYASGSQVNVIVPATVKAGDDLRLVVREPDGRILDTGITTRYVPVPSAFARLDAVLYSDLASLQIAGVVGYYEGIADLRLRSETRKREVAQATQTADRPGQVGNGFGAFDATFIAPEAVAPLDGELLSVGYINGNGDYERLGCFEYCFDLSGHGTCTGGPRSCP